jgi:single-stranded DNA-binding protein
MTIAKAAVTGIVYRAPEKRFTQNNIAVSSFVLNIGDREETLIRVLSKRNALNDIVETFKKGDKVLIEGRLQVAVAKMDDGSEKRIYEIDANTIESMGAGGATPSNNNEEIVQFAQEDFSDELIGEDEIPF